MDNGQDAPEKKSYEAFGLYDAVRLWILEELKEAIEAMEKVNKLEMAGHKINEDDPKAIEFKAKTISLYMTIKDKLHYPERTESFKPLYNLSTFLENKTSPRYLKIVHAKYYLSLMRTFIEVDGVTKFERQKRDPSNLPAELIGL